MDTALWSKIENFSLDNPNDQYGFSTRLAFENKWTSFFTKMAILEYKKFMYLAATSSEMVSPSEAVDIVWHQHLIFTNSYSDLCTLLGKRIEHIPSTHNRADFEKFHKAKERTRELYEINFGNQPDEIWNYSNELDSLHLPQSTLKISTLKYAFLVSMFLLIFPIYFMIRDILIEIGNPDFLIKYLILCGVAIGLLELYVRFSFNSFYDKIKANLILSNLSPFELVFMEQDKIEFVVQGVVNNLISTKKIKVVGDNKLEIIDNSLTENQYENCALELMKSYHTPMPYIQLYYTLKRMPTFDQIQKSVNRIKETITNSKQFTFVIIIVMVVLGLLLSIGFSRLISGISRDKPVTFLVFTMIFLVVLADYYLNRILKFFFQKTISQSFKQEKSNTTIEKDWELNYFLFGNMVLVNSFIPLISTTNTSNFSSSNSSSNSCSSGGSSCGSSCGGSCGSSCGGCGGD
ncbi:hypothetical protein AR687_06120 [Flavobacteriaceae bacterium CRH]|nr:hypothetical protein AR687_06120 [Flavobacteriaceae bacterium CRH]